MAGASLDRSGHDPATAPRIAVAGAVDKEAPDHAANVHVLYPSSAASSATDKVPAAAIPVPVAGHHSGAAPQRRAADAWRRDVEFLQSTSKPGCGAGVLIIMAFGAISLILLTVASYAQTRTLDLPTMKVEGKAEPRIGGHNTDPCVAVDIAGHKAGDTDCAAQRLQDAAKAAQDRAKDQPVPNISTATSPDTKIGVANEAATKQRLGDNFGKSVLPQRPTPPLVEPSPLARH